MKAFLAELTRIVPGVTFSLHVVASTDSDPVPLNSVPPHLVPESVLLITEWERRGKKMSATQYCARLAIEKNPKLFAAHYAADLANLFKEIEAAAVA